MTATFSVIVKVRVFREMARSSWVAVPSTHESVSGGFGFRFGLRVRGLGFRDLGFKVQGSGVLSLGFNGSGARHVNFCSKTFHVNMPLKSSPKVKAPEL